MVAVTVDSPEAVQKLSADNKLKCSKVREGKGGRNQACVVCIGRNGIGRWGRSKPPSMRRDARWRLAGRLASASASFDPPPPPLDALHPSLPLVQFSWTFCRTRPGASSACWVWRSGLRMPPRCLGASALPPSWRTEFCSSW